MNIMVTGSAGFIGFHLTKALLEAGHTVVGFDNLNDYYDVNLKKSRLKECGIVADVFEEGAELQSSLYPAYRFVYGNLENYELLSKICHTSHFDVFVNLAAQAGVRYSIDNPQAYAQSNLVGFLNVLEAARHASIGHLVYASSSSVYGMNNEVPFTESQPTDQPVSLYAATKKANELMAHTYSHLYGIRTTGLRFFTVYGPWGRPDMAYFSFTKAILEGKPIKVFNEGKLRRDFTYIDDIISGCLKVIENVAVEDEKYQPANIYNIGNSDPVWLMDFIKALETALDKNAVLNYVEMQAGDVYQTYASVEKLSTTFAYRPKTQLSAGINTFVNWYMGYYKA